MDISTIEALVAGWLPTITAVCGVVAVIVKIINMFSDQTKKLKEALEEFNTTANTTRRANAKTLDESKKSQDKIKELETKLEAFESYMIALGNTIESLDEYIRKNVDNSEGIKEND